MHSDMKEIIRERLSVVTGLPESAFPDNADLRRQVGLDSIEVIEVIAKLEDWFLISIPNEDYGRFKTVKMIEEYLIERAVETP